MWSSPVSKTLNRPPFCRASLACTARATTSPRRCRPPRSPASSAPARPRAPSAAPSPDAGGASGPAATLGQVEQFPVGHGKHGEVRRGGSVQLRQHFPPASDQRCLKLLPASDAGRLVEPLAAQPQDAHGKGALLGLQVL